METCGVGLAKIGFKLMMNLENSFTGEKNEEKKESCESWNINFDCETSVLKLRYQHLILMRG